MRDWNLNQRAFCQTLEMLPPALQPQATFSLSYQTKMHVALNSCL